MKVAVSGELTVCLAFVVVCDVDSVFILIIRQLNLLFNLFLNKLPLLY